MLLRLAFPRLMPSLRPHLPHPETRRNKETQRKLKLHLDLDYLKITSMLNNRELNNRELNNNSREMLLRRRTHKARVKASSKTKRRKLLEKKVNDEIRSNI